MLIGEGVFYVDELTGKVRICSALLVSVGPENLFLYGPLYLSTMPVVFPHPRNKVFDTLKEAEAEVAKGNNEFCEDCGVFNFHLKVKNG